MERGEGRPGREYCIMAVLYSCCTLPQETALSKYAKKILLASKPAPVLESLYKGRGQWQLGSLTHAINAEANGYNPLPDFPLKAPDPSVRDVEDETWGRPRSGSTKKKNEKGFYSDTESEGESSSGSDFYSSLSGSDDSGSEDSEEDSSGEFHLSVEGAA